MWTSECNCGMSMQKACNLPQPPNDSVLATCSDSHYTLSECCIADQWMTEAMWGHRDCTDLMLTQSTASLFVGGETTFHCLLLSCPLVVHQLSSSLTKTTSWMSVTRNKYHNDLAHVSKSLVCSAISLTLVNSHTDSRNVVLSLQTLPPHPNTESDWCWRMEWG